ncbi:MAG: hypothetical protein P9L98_02860 [Candidatus Kaelpia imicola]|nr:hypothetical protein [Candidatus Kaelpia imicola]
MIRIRKITVLVFCLSSLLLTVSFAHPPWKITIETRGKDIEVTVYHEVADPEEHYIERIDVYLNGIRHADMEFSTQTDDLQIVRLSLPPLKKGDFIDVMAFCNRGGELIENLTVE